ncbi:histone-lysine n-methyltransferase setd3-like, partial [Nannochloropsis oceanica]
MQPSFSYSSSSFPASSFLTGDRRASSKATHSDVTTTSSSSSPVDLASASVSSPASSVNLNPYVGGATGGSSGSGLKTSLDPIGRIDANPQALLEWVIEGRGKLHDAVSLTHAPSSVDGEEEDASVAAAAAAAAASTAAGVGGSEELARWTLTTTEEVKEGTVLVSIPNILTLSPVRRKYKLPSGLKDLLSHKASSSSSSSDDGAAAAAISALVGDSAVSELLEKAVIDERIQRVMDSFPETFWRIKLAVLLVAERMKGPQSYWWPYLRNLPEKYAHMPIFYNNSEFGSIQIPSLMRTVQSRCRMLVNISDGYLRQLSHAGPDENPFLDDVHANDMGWGLCAASS